MDQFLSSMFPVCHAFLSVRCSLVVICWEQADLLTLLYMMFYCVFVTFTFTVLGQIFDCIDFWSVPFFLPWCRF